MESAGLPNWFLGPPPLGETWPKPGCPIASYCAPGVTRYAFTVATIGEARRDRGYTNGTGHHRSNVPLGISCWKIRNPSTTMAATANTNTRIARLVIRTYTAPSQSGPVTVGELHSGGCSKSYPHPQLDSPGVARHFCALNIKQGSQSRSASPILEEQAGGLPPGTHAPA